MTTVDALPATQAELPMQSPVSIEVVARCRSFTDALLLAVQVSGKQSKAVAIDLDIDAGQWSRILSHKAHFPHDKLPLFCDVVGNEVVLQWLNYSRGYEPLPPRRESALQQRIRELERELEVRSIREAALREAIGGRQ